MATAKNYQTSTFFLRLEDIDFTSAESSMKLCTQQMPQLQSGNEHSQLNSFSQSHQQTEHTQDTTILNQSVIVMQSGLPQSDYLDDDITEQNYFKNVPKANTFPFYFL